MTDTYKTPTNKGGQREGAGRPRNKEQKFKKLVFITQEAIDFMAELGNGYISRGIDLATKKLKKGGKKS